MSKNLSRLSLVLMVMGSMIPALAQTQPCQAGSLANVLGTSCTVGPLTLNFQTFFTAGGDTFSSSGSTTVPITPADIGFVPIQSGNQFGFKLLTNFVDGPGADSSFSGAHILQFGYTPQLVSPDLEIRSADLSMEATASNLPQAIEFVQILDFQNFTNSGFLDTDTALSNENGVVLFNQPTNNVNLEVPGFLSTGFADAPFTTQLFSFSTGQGSDSLTSATFLYTLGPIIPAPALGSFTYTNIDPPDHLGATVSGMNNVGQRVGIFADDQGSLHGYLQDKNGQVTTIDFPGAIETLPEGINNHGDVTGLYVDLTGFSHGFVIRDGIPTTLDVPDALATSPIGINDRGEVAGQYQSSDQGFHGFLFKDGQFTTIDQGPEAGFLASTFAIGVNYSGEVAGGFFDPDTFRGFSETGGVFSSIDIPGQGDTLPEGINATGDIVGGYRDINFVQHGFILSKGNFLSLDFPGATATFPLGINASRNIVGIYFDDAGNVHNFLAQPAPGSGNGLRPQTSSRPIPPVKPDCSNGEWRRHGMRIRDFAGCRVGH